MNPVIPNKPAIIPITAEYSCRFDDLLSSEFVPNCTGHPSRFTEAFASVFEHWSLESRTPSPSESKVSSGEQPSDSTLVDGLSGQLSGFEPPRLSPYPSPSRSDHCVESLGNASLLSPTPSPSESVVSPASLGKSSELSPTRHRRNPSIQHRHLEIHQFHHHNHHHQNLRFQHFWRDYFKS